MHFICPDSLWNDYWQLDCVYFGEWTEVSHNPRHNLTKVGCEGDITVASAALRSVLKMVLNLPQTEFLKVPVNPRGAAVAECVPL